jgi:RNA polymerase sigma-70 factor (TIGR02943 family)
MDNGDLKNWVIQYTNDLYKWAYYKTSSVETAEDLVQDTFWAAAEKLDKFKGESSPKTWLFSILNYKIIDHYRKRVNQAIPIENNVISNLFDTDGDWQKEKRPKEWEEEEKHLLDDSDFQLVLANCFDALPEKWSICVKLKYLSEKSSDEICQEIGIAPTNLWQIVHRAKLQLRTCVENNWFKN